MTSSYDRPDRVALERLEPIVRRLTEELAAWRKRCQRAEAELAELKARGGTLAGPELLQVRQRIVDLERENQELRGRVVAAREDMTLLHSRLVFLEAREGAA
jgi:predicted  nucleic acid-binding Zn-ribbon protein